MALDSSFVTIRSYSPREKVHTSKTVPIGTPVDLKDQKIQRVFSDVLRVPIPRRADRNDVNLVKQLDLRGPRTPSPIEKVDSPRAPTPLPFPNVARTPSPSEKVDSPRPLTPLPAPPIQKVAEFLRPIPPEIERQNQILERILSPPRSTERLSFTQIHAQRTSEELEVFQKLMDSFRCMQSYSEKVQARYNNKRKPVERNRLPYCDIEMEVDQEISALMGEPKMKKMLPTKEKRTSEK